MSGRGFQALLVSFLVCQMADASLGFLYSHVARLSLAAVMGAGISVVFVQVVFPEEA
jgi:hypothetical protein